MNFVALPLAFILLYGCSHQQRPFRAPTSYEEAASREAEPLSEQTITSEDHLLSFQVRAKSAPSVQLQSGELSYYYSQVDVGSTTPIECYFYQTEISPGSTLKNISDRILDNKEVVGQVKEKQVHLFGAGAIGSSPYLFLSTLFTTAEGGITRTGNLKAMISIKDESSVLCVHNEVGFNQTFLERFSEISTSFSFQSAPSPEVLYKDVLVLKAGEVPVGFVANYVLAGEAKTKVWIQKSSLLLPHSSSTQTYDDVSLEVSNREGLLVLGRYKHEENSNLSHMLEISTVDGRLYQVKGFQHGKKIQATMSTDGLISRYGHSSMVSRKIFGQDLQHFSVPYYEPAANPVGPSRMRTTVKELRSNGALVRLDDGESVSTADVGEDGIIKEIIVPVGAIQIHGQRIFSSGSLKPD